MSDLHESRQNATRPPRFGMVWDGVYDIKTVNPSRAAVQALYGAMCSFAYGKKGHPKICRLSQEALGELTGLCINTIAKCIGLLRSNDLILEIGSYKVGSHGVQYEMIPKGLSVLSEDKLNGDMSAPSGNKCNGENDLSSLSEDDPLTQLGPSPHSVRMTPSLSEDNTESTHKLNIHTTEVVSVCNLTEKYEEKIVAGARDVEKVLKHVCPSANYDFADIFNATYTWGSWEVKAVIEKRCNKDTRSWNAVLYHLKDKPRCKRNKTKVVNSKMKEG